MKRTLIQIVLLFLSFQAQAQRVLESIPIKFVDNYIFIEATVNNREKSLNFLFDTGAGITVIDSKIADQLLLEINSEAKINTSGKSLLSKESTGNKMKLGGKSYWIAST